MFSVVPYKSIHFNLWNNFVEKTTNTSFLFHRNFIEYHSHKFKDFSLLIFKNKTLVAILPAHVAESTVYSHQGLTYGGIFISEIFEREELKYMISFLISYVKAQGYSVIKIKETPLFYKDSSHPVIDCLQEENTAKIVKFTNVLCVDFDKFTIHKSKRKHYNKAKKKGLIIKAENTFSKFWNSVLIPKLQTKYNAKPVHSLREIEYLYNKFPNRITQYNAYLNDNIVAGVTILDKGHVVKSQYSASTDLGEQNYAIDFLFVHLLQLYKQKGKHYFSMGTVTNDSTLGYNPGLLQQKVEFGCKAYTVKSYQINLDD